METNAFRELKHVIHHSRKPSPTNPLARLWNDQSEYLVNAYMVSCTICIVRVKNVMVRC